MLLTDLMENPSKIRSKKGQFTFDLAIAVIVLSFILYFGLFTIAEIHKTNEKTLEDQILFNRLISIADYLVKIGAVETNENIYGSKAIYHHKITYLSFNQININDLEQKMQLKELHIDFCSLDGCNSFYQNNMCVNRIILFNNEISVLRVCGK